MQENLKVGAVFTTQVVVLEIKDGRAECEVITARGHKLPFSFPYKDNILEVMLRFDIVPEIV